MDQKTSILINRQVPEFVREEYPLFIDFIKAYYEFLEQKQEIKLNDLLNQKEKLLTLFDVDKSIDEFTTQFFNTFVNYFPKNVATTKEFLIKNVLPLYKAKGSEKSFELLFKILFGADVAIEYPKNNVLIASDGKWQIDHTIKITTDISSIYIGDGVTKEFTILNCSCPITNVSFEGRLNVYINDFEQLEGNDFYILYEYNKIIFNYPIAAGSVLEIFYENADPSILLNRKLIGRTSGASVVSENLVSRILDNKIIYEILLDHKTQIGNFSIGEELITKVFVNDTLVNVVLRTLSELKSVEIIDGGSNYELTDKIIINSPDAEIVPKAVISKRSNGPIAYIEIMNSGAGFQKDRQIFVDGIGLPNVDIEITSVSTKQKPSFFTPNTFIISSDIISDIDPANTQIDVSNYGFVGYTGNANLSTVISHTFSNTAFENIGQIYGVQVNFAKIRLNANTTLDAEPAKVMIANAGFTSTNTEISIKSFGTLGKLEIVNPGYNYVVGDEIEFNNVDKSWGLGAFAEVTEVTANGAIKQVEFVPAKISGTANVSNTSVIVTGKGTLFKKELIVGNQIRINGENKYVTNISSNTSLNVNSTFSQTANNKPIRLFDVFLLGGQGYEQNSLPTANVISTTGSSAQIIVNTILGDGEEFKIYPSNTVYGQILEISVTDPGKSIISLPSIDLTQGGDGNAIATSNLEFSYQTYPGRWINSDGILSSSAIKLQDKDYYHKYSYVVSSFIQFVKYKDIIKSLLHPAGLQIYAKYNLINEIPSSNLDEELPDPGLDERLHVFDLNMDSDETIYKNFIATSIFNDEEKYFNINKKLIDINNITESKIIGFNKKLSHQFNAIDNGNVTKIIELNDYVEVDYVDIGYFEPLIETRTF